MADNENGVNGVFEIGGTYASAPSHQTQGATQTINHNHSLYLHASDVSGVSLIFLQLTSTNNYSLWSRSMRIALLGRNKLGFVDGTWKKERFREEFRGQWERVNVIVLSWLMNSVANHLLSGIVYASNAWSVWEDLRKRFNKVNGS